jgi:hypothetical protein
MPTRRTGRQTTKRSRDGCRTIASYMLPPMLILTLAESAIIVRHLRDSAPVVAGKSASPTNGTLGFEGLAHLMEPQCGGVGNYTPRISKRSIKPFSIRNTRPTI